ncbi:unnamed protein product [Caenorhabditis bovis]|uniref:Lysozyme n=1 Tax=Caenorhabditis bovis TaxID=2654633 RepID=A0A8S1ETI6_9PELO|nr:unnamed protein product [Caenorhabditis bovis]
MFKILILVSIIAASASVAIPKPLPFVDSSLPLQFEQNVPQPAPAIISNSAAGWKYGIDVSMPTTRQQMLNIKEAAYTAVFVRAYNPMGQGGFDANSCDTLQYAYHAGLSIEIYMTPQPASSKAGYQQVDELYNGLINCGITPRLLWIQVTSPINWPVNASQNVNFLNNIISRAKQYGMGVGVYTNRFEWGQITAGWSSIGSDVLLWYWNVYGPGVTGETPANFDDFRPFGCWRSATIKQFAQSEILFGLTVNRDVFYTSSALNNNVIVDKSI